MCSACTSSLIHIYTMWRCYAIRLVTLLALALLSVFSPSILMYLTRLLFPVLDVPRLPLAFPSKAVFLYARLFAALRGFALPGFSTSASAVDGSRITAEARPPVESHCTDIFDSLFFQLFFFSWCPHPSCPTPLRPSRSQAAMLYHTGVYGARR